VATAGRERRSEKEGEKRRSRNIEGKTKRDPKKRWMAMREGPIGKWRTMLLGRPLDLLPSQHRYVTTSSSSISFFSTTVFVDQIMYLSKPETVLLKSKNLSKHRKLDLKKPP
jgi:hypothetical protein